MKKDTNKKNYGLIGYPIEHSFSKDYFLDKFNMLGIQAGFKLYNDVNLLNIIRKIRQEKILSGFSVTKPFKEEIIQHLDLIDKEAFEIGAVNSVKILNEGDDIKLKGYNTDTYGFLESLSPHIQHTHTQALILGTGGASKAVAYALDKLSIDYLFVTRRPTACKHIRYSILHQDLIRQHPLIINTTPLGMFPVTEDFPPIPYQFITSGHLLFDLIYNPIETIFLKKGKEQGAHTINGLQMLHIQADHSWEIWNK
jgi:shikimate dehydrogenase